MEPSWLPTAMKTVTTENTKIIKKTLSFLIKIEGVEVEAKIHQKLVHNGIKIKINFFMCFERLLDRFWTDFGWILDPSWSQVGSKIGPRGAKLGPR